MNFELENYSIRLINREDSQAFYNLIQNNRARLEDFFAGTVARTKTLEETTAFCIRIEQMILDKEYLPFLLIDKSSANPIGLIDFKNINWNVPKAEVGAFIDQDFEGVGFITEACNLLLEEVSKTYQFKKIYCRVAPQNKRSINTVLRLGFKQEGVLKRDYKTTKGEIVDLNIYGILYDN